MIVVRVKPESRMLMPAHADPLDMYMFAMDEEVARQALLGRFMYILEEDDIELSNTEEYLEEIL